MRSQDFDRIFALRQKRSGRILRAPSFPQDLSSDAQNVMRQGFAGMLWSKQFYHYVVKEWLEGDPGNPPPPAGAQEGPQSRVASSL